MQQKFDRQKKNRDLHQFPVGHILHVIHHPSADIGLLIA